MPFTLAGATALLSQARDVTLLGHVNPDADALGSALALGIALRQRGARARVSFAEPATVPDSLRGLDSAGLLVPPDRLPERDELLVTLDTPDPRRLGALAQRLPTADAVLVIDHHASNTYFGTCHVVDTTAEATAVLVLRVLDELGHALDPEIASCLYAGLVTDTSSFRRATGHTHRMAARLVDAGADPQVLGHELLDAHPFAWLPMLAEVLGTAGLEPAAAGGLGMVHATVTPESAALVRSEEIESVVDVVRGTSEAEVAVVLKSAGPNRWTVSLRAKRAVDVSAAARTLGGGGHQLAAGCTVDGTAEEALSAVRAALDTAPRL